MRPEIANIPITDARRRSQTKTETIMPGLKPAAWLIAESTLGLVRANLREASRVLEAALTNQRRRLFLFVISLGSLERIYFLLTLLFHLVMGRKITGAGSPFDGRIRIAGAELSSGKIHRALTSLALLHDRMAGTAVVAASRFRHEGTF